MMFTVFGNHVNIIKKTMFLTIVRASKDLVPNTCFILFLSYQNFKLGVVAAITFAIIFYAAFKRLRVKNSG